MLQIVNAEHVLAGARPIKGPVVNTRMHTGVYRWLAATNGGTLLLAWGMFRDAGEALFMIAICAVYVAMYFGTPWAMARAAKIDLRETRSLGDFLNKPFETCTGKIKGWEAMVQVCLIPASILFAFAGFWLILVTVR